MEIDTLDTHCEKYDIKVKSPTSVVLNENRMRRDAIHSKTSTYSFSSDDTDYWKQLDDMWQKKIIDIHNRSHKNLLSNK